MNETRKCPKCLSGTMSTWWIQFTGNYQITRIKLTCDNPQCQFTIIEEPYCLCNTHLRTWRAYDEKS